MFNIHREFRKDENKIIPFQLIKPVVGYSSPAATEAINAANINLATLSITLPVAESFVVMLINTSSSGSDSSLDVAAIKTCPPGKNVVEFAMNSGNYSIFLISKEFQNGYITTTSNIVSEADVNSSPYETFSPPESKTIQLKESTTPTGNGLKRNPNVNNPADWYNFQDSYSSSTLTWTEKQYEASQNLTFFIDYKRLVVEAIDCFKNNLPIHDSIGGINTGSLSVALDIIKSKTDIIRLFATSDNTSLIKNNREIAEFNSAIISSADDIYKTISLHEALDDKFTSEWYGKLYMQPQGVGYFNEVAARHNERAYTVKYSIANNLMGSIGGALSTMHENQEIVNNFIHQAASFTRNAANAVLNLYFVDARANSNVWPKSNASGQEDSGAMVLLQEYTKELALDIINSMYVNLLNKLVYINERISEFGDMIFAASADQNVQQIGHLATLQNIRFLKNKLTEIGSDVWTSVINSNAVIFERIGNIEKIISSTLSTINPVISLDQAAVSSSDVEIFYTDDIDTPNIAAKKLSNVLIDLSEGMKAINVNALSEIGNYAIIIKPKKYVLNVDQNVLSNASVLQILNANEILGISGADDKYKRPNALFGWSLQMLGADINNPDLIGDVRKIISSSWNSDVLRVAISPANRISSAVRVYIWNSFSPVMISLKIKEHDEQTLSYSLYSKKEFNTTTGLCTIYDAFGQPWKLQSIGTRELSVEDKNIIEFRDPKDL
jgi:hypothetical protein